MGKYIFGMRPRHPFIEETLVSGIVYNLRSRSSTNRSGRPKGVGKLVYQQSRKRYVVLCYDEECDMHFRSEVSK